MNLLAPTYAYQDPLDLFTLVPDVQKLTVEFLEPTEIKELYVTCKNSKVMFEELTKHTCLIIDCKRIITNEELKWFETHNIELKLLETFENELGTQTWYKNGKIHRDNDLPAVINLYGDQIWYKNGEIHRDNDLPAIIYSNGAQYWYQNGLFHRDNDLPAIIFITGTQHWYKNGSLHRDNDLPAMVFADGSKQWYKNDERYFPS